MKSRKKTKHYLLEGKKYRFDRNTLNGCCNYRAKEKGINIGKCEEELGTAVFNEPRTVKAWRFGQNAPMDIETVKRIADFFNIDFHTLLIEEVEDFMDNKLSETQKNAVTKVYSSISDFLTDFSESGGCFCEIPSRSEVNKSFEQIVFYSSLRYYEIKKLLLSFYPVLGKNPIYDELLFFINSDLLELFSYDDECDNKLLFYWEGIHGDKAFEDEVLCRKKLNLIIDRYM